MAVFMKNMVDPLGVKLLKKILVNYINSLI